MDEQYVYTYHYSLGRNARTLVVRPLNKALIFLCLPLEVSYIEKVFEVWEKAKTYLIFFRLCMYSLLKERENKKDYFSQK